MLIRAILPDYILDEHSDRRKVLEGDFTNEQIQNTNGDGYNVYFLPNYPSIYNPGFTVDGSHIDVFEYVFVDMDLKDNKYTKDTFLDKVAEFPLMPTRIVDSGNGIHVYFKISDLDALSFLRLNRRLCRYFDTDEAVSKVYQLMRLPGTLNTKHKDKVVECSLLLQTDNIYSCEQLDKLLPVITESDEEYCLEHYNKTYSVERKNLKIDDKIPLKFSQLIKGNKEVREIWAGGLDDRSKGDFRLAHILFANDFTKSEAMSVMVNCPKALKRAPNHRVSYAANIVDQIWLAEERPAEEFIRLSSSVQDILSASEETLKGIRFPCYTYLDNTHHGFRLGQVIGLVGGSGIGKTAIALNMFLGFVENNPNYTHMFISLEQRKEAIALRWKYLCGTNTRLHEKVEIVDNYDSTTGKFRDLSLKNLKDYILRFKQVTGKQVGCVVVDHIGILNEESNGTDIDKLMRICKKMKDFAEELGVLLVMQSQAPREKAGIGDLQLNKDAAYGTVKFENFCDYLITLWQPLKRVYFQGAPTCTAYKFCKIREKREDIDKIREDVCYRLFFDPSTQKMREMTQIEEKAFDFWNSEAVKLRKEDKKSEIIPYVSAKFIPDTVSKGALQ